MSKIAEQAEVKISKLASKMGCTPEGITWLKNALDPFPDVQRELQGYPDSIKTPSVVQYFREELQVGAPGSVDWDCNIFHPGLETGSNTGWYSTNHFDNGRLFGSAGQAGGYPSGIIEVRKGTAGVAQDTTSTMQSMIPKVDLALPHRICALAFEVYNTSAEINKSGAVITWKQPSVLSEDVRSIGQAAVPMDKKSKSEAAAAVAIGPVMARQLNDAPEDAASALLLEGSLEWEASKGAYCVGTQGSADQDPRSNSNSSYNWLVSGSNIVYGQGIHVGTNVSYTDTIWTKSGFDQFGAYFTGLTKDTKLKIVLHYIIERFPTLANTDLITLARPSMTYDPHSLELYTHLAACLPTGTWVENNDLGSFISSVASMAQKVIPPLISSLNKVLNPDESTKAMAKKEQEAKIRDEVNKAMYKATPLSFVVEQPKLVRQEPRQRQPQQQQPKPNGQKSNNPYYQAVLGSQPQYVLPGNRQVQNVNKIPKGAKAIGRNVDIQRQNRGAQWEINPNF